MSDYVIKQYKRIHKDSNPSDLEKGKIKRETTKYIKMRKKTEVLTGEILRDIQNTSEFNDEMYEQLKEAEEAAEQEKRTAKTHKKRLNRLKNHKDFY